MKEDCESTNSLPSYKNPPVIEVACGIKFKKIKKFKAPHFGLFWDKLRKKFPFCQHAPTLGFPDPSETEPAFELPLPRIWFINKEKNGLIQLQENIFLYNWRKMQPEESYPRYDTVIKAFQNNAQVEQIVTIMPSNETQAKIIKKYPLISFKPLKLRLMQYTINETTYYIGTTLMDAEYTVNDFKAVYHARWGIEELYKVTKQIIEVDDFHGKAERTVKQELFAHFVLITMSRLCSNNSENILNNFLNASSDENEENVSTQINFKNCLTTVSRHLENFMFAPAQSIKNVMNDITQSISRYQQKMRPNRSYDRRSMKPINKWRRSPVGV